MRKMHGIIMDKKEMHQKDSMFLQECFRDITACHYEEEIADAVT